MITHILCVQEKYFASTILIYPCNSVHYTSAAGILQCIISFLECTQWQRVDNTQSGPLACTPGQHGNILCLRTSCLSTVEGEWSSPQILHFDA